MKKSSSTKRLSHLCSELKARLDAFDEMEESVEKKTPQKQAQKRKRLFTELKEKLDTVS